MVSLGAELIDADVVGHEAYMPNAEAWRQVLEAFGDGILGPENEIDRRALGAIVFSDPQQLARLKRNYAPAYGGDGAGKDRRISREGSGRGRGGGGATV